jgi:hypothetical protein
VSSCDELITTLKGDWCKRFKFRLKVSVKEKVTAGEALGHYTVEFIRAAFQYYLSDNDTHEMGTPGLGQFFRLFNKYGCRVTLPKRGKEKTTKYDWKDNEYKCEYTIHHPDILKRRPRGPCNGSAQIDDWDGNTELPDCHPDPCWMCGGRMWRQDIANNSKED